ncbi:uncharacterized protein [Rutidosis leptorrhynchoides]|uniref:uncharacterized protein isoform X2 n=1 Tax=Rutidosis leptorrhynchoides TaxID=125765 RepID=UPI003A990835
MGVQQQVIPSDCVSTSDSTPWSLGNKRWDKAEQAAEGLLLKFQPTVEAERQRNSVINYLKGLLIHNLDCEVFAYGSVPLKTYLPDGDIDLSVVGGRTQNLIKEIASLLKSEARNRSHVFVVKDVQVIGGAEVKIVKCMVQNLVVDISINQINGLCTLCFLEQVDRVIMKDHIFKRSIILIKAWCYYESRTLGAHVGLISTYGLETLVLYIFHIFHLSLNGPLSVLYKFLEYFSVFDWDNYGISLMGPVLLSELPNIVAERPPNGDNLLLEVGFLRHCSETLSNPVKPGDLFPKKHLNIIDPLNDHNNLGRSVSQGNFFRIRSAFTYGARQLCEILMDEDKNIGDELQAFFGNTLKMHGTDQRFDLSDDIVTLSLTTCIARAENTPPTMVAEKPMNSNGENSDLCTEEEVAKSVRIPFYAPHLLFNFSKSVNEVQKQSVVVEEEVPSTDVSFIQSEPLDLTGDLMSHIACLDHVRFRNSYFFGPRGMMGPLPPPILMNLIRSESSAIGVVPRPPFLPPDHMFMPGPPFVPNDSALMAPTNYFSDINGPQHGYRPSTSNSTNNGTQNPQDFTPQHEVSPGFGPVPLPVHPREPLLHRRRNPNANRASQPDGSQRPRSHSGSMYNHHRTI